MWTTSRSVLAVLLASGVLAAGCAPLVRETWSKPGATRQSVSRDAFDCEREASVDPTHGQEQGAYGFSVRKNERVFDACMRARGYQPVSSLSPGADLG